MTQAKVSYDELQNGWQLHLTGDWRIWALSELGDQIPLIDQETAQSFNMEAFATLPKIAHIDLTQLDSLDSAGALQLLHLVEDLLGDAQQLPEFHGGKATHLAMIEEVHDHWKKESLPKMHVPGLIRLLNRAGQAVFAVIREAAEYISFLGATLIALIWALLRPWKLRWTSLFHFMEETGINAMPIIATLSFFVGAVLVFIGANLLSQFGFEILTVTLLGIAMLREFGVVIMAILLAGRSDSAFTAQIGAMKMREEIDALKVMGFDPMQVLVVPRILAILLVSPLLAFVSMMAGLFGGFCVTWFILGINPAQFSIQFADNVDIIHFWAGMAKAPVFALLVGITGCRHGLRVGGDVQSLGQRTTQSVVESIFLIIVFDAIFALLFLELGI